MLKPFPEGSVDIVQIYDNIEAAKRHVLALKDEFNLTKLCLGDFGYYNDHWAAYMQVWQPQSEYQEGDKDDNL